MDMPSLPLPLPRAAEVAGARAACFIHVVQPNHSFLGNSYFGRLGDFSLQRWGFYGDGQFLTMFVCLVAIALGHVSPRHIYHLYLGIWGYYMYSNVPSEHLS